MDSEGCGPSSEQGSDPREALQSREVDLEGAGDSDHEDLDQDPEESTVNDLRLFDGDIPEGYEYPDPHLSDKLQQKCAEAARAVISGDIEQTTLDSKIPYHAWMNAQLRPGIHRFSATVNIPQIDVTARPSSTEEFWELLERLGIDRLFLHEIDICRIKPSDLYVYIDALLNPTYYFRRTIPALKTLYLFAGPDWAARGWRASYVSAGASVVPNPQKAEDEEEWKARWEAEMLWRDREMEISQDPTPWTAPCEDERVSRTIRELSPTVDMDFDFLEYDSTGTFATVNLGPIVPPGKSKDKAPKNPVVVKVARDDTGALVAEDKFGPAKRLPALVARIVDAIYNCETYRGLPKKKNLYQAFPKHFTNRGDVSHDSILRHFTPAEMGIAPSLWMFLNNNFAHHNAHGEDNPNSTVTGMARSYEPRSAEQFRSGADTSGSTRRGQFGASRTSSDANHNPVNPDANAQHPLITKTALLHAVKQGKVTAEDLGMVRMGTAWKSLHTAAKAIIERQHQIEVWANEERRLQASQKKFWTTEVRKHHDTAVAAVDHANSLRHILERAGLEIPEDLQTPVFVNRTLRRYKPDIPDRRSRDFKRQVSMALANRPQATLRLERCDRPGRKDGPPTGEGDTTTTPAARKRKVPSERATISDGPRGGSQTKIRKSSKRVKRDNITGKGRRIPVEDEAPW